MLRRCKEEHRPLFSEANGWRNWPEGAKEEEVLDWLCTLFNAIREIATEEGFTTAPYRTVLALPGQRCTQERDFYTAIFRLVTLSSTMTKKIRPGRLSLSIWILPSRSNENGRPEREVRQGQERLWH